MWLADSKGCRTFDHAKRWAGAFYGAQRPARLLQRHTRTRWRILLRQTERHRRQKLTVVQPAASSQHQEGSFSRASRPCAKDPLALEAERCQKVIVWIGHFVTDASVADL